MYNKCARCGRELEINEYMQNSRGLEILNKTIILHFCNYCVELIDRSDE